MFAPRQIALLAAAVLAACAALPSSASAFSVVPAASRFAASSSRRVVPSGTTALSMTDGGGGDGGPDFDAGIVSESVSAPPPAAAAAPQAKEPEGTEYPLDVPSPILLGGSMILGIASIGSIFELSGGHPVNGVVVSAAIAALGFPLCLFLFYAAVKKGQAETEEDDKEFLNNKY